MTAEDYSDCILKIVYKLYHAKCVSFPKHVLNQGFCLEKKEEGIPRQRLILHLNPPPYYCFPVRAQFFFLNSTTVKRRRDNDKKLYQPIDQYCRREKKEKLVSLSSELVNIFQFVHCMPACMKDQLVVQDVMIGSQCVISLESH